MATRKKSRKHRGNNRKKKCNALRKKFHLYLKNDNMTLQELLAIGRHVERCNHCKSEMTFWFKILLSYGDECERQFQSVQPPLPSLPQSIIAREVAASLSTDPANQPFLMLIDQYRLAGGKFPSS